MYITFVDEQISTLCSTYTHSKMKFRNIEARKLLLVVKISKEHVKCRKETKIWRRL